MKTFLICLSTVLFQLCLSVSDFGEYKAFSEEIDRQHTEILKKNSRIAMKEMGIAHKEEFTRAEFKEILRRALTQENGSEKEHLESVEDMLGKLVANVPDKFPASHLDRYLQLKKLYEKSFDFFDADNDTNDEDDEFFDKIHDAMKDML